MKRLVVKGRYLYWDNGEPFFYLADTAWELLHRLNREEIREYLSVRASQGFTAVQTVALAELDGLSKPNAFGRLPLKTNGETELPDPAEPDTQGPYSYWDHVDFAVDESEKHDMFVALLPTWGDKFAPLWGRGPVIFTSENAREYGKWIARRYASRWNVIWILGGDRPLDDFGRSVVDGMAQGIREEDVSHLITFHPPGGTASTDFLIDAKYVDFHTAQTGHDVKKCYRSDEEMLRMAQVSPKPYMDSESRYEDHPACFNPALGYFWGQAETRQNAYWNLLAGVCGHTFGNHDIWCCNTEPGEYFTFHWRDALKHPAADQMKWVKQLRMRRDFSSFRPAPSVFCESYEGEGHLAAATGKGYCYVYTPLGLPFTVDFTKARFSSESVKAIWYNPRSGEQTIFGIYPADGKNLFVPPSNGKGMDWVLILEDAK